VPFALAGGLALDKAWIRWKRLPSLGQSPRAA